MFVLSGWGSLEWFVVELFLIEILSENVVWWTDWLTVVVSWEVSSVLEEVVDSILSKLLSENVAAFSVGWLGHTG